MGKLHAIAALLFMSAMLGGCVSKPEIPFDRSAADIKTIGILTPACPDTAAVTLATSLGKNMGLIGALVDAGMEAARESKFNASLHQASFSFRDETEKALSDHLSAHGFTVSVLPVTRTSRSDFLKQYPKAEDTKVDAYLDVVVLGYGYIAANISDSTPYRPVTAMRVRLVRSRDAATLMEDSVIYNPIDGAVNAITVSPDPAYVFTDFDALTANPTQATKGLEVCVDQSADAVAKLLR